MLLSRLAAAAAASACRHGAAGSWACCAASGSLQERLLLLCSGATPHQPLTSTSVATISTTSGSSSSSGGAHPGSRDQAAGAGAEADPSTQRHVLKCTTAARSPVSQAVAFMLDRDVMPPQQLAAKMQGLCAQLHQDVAAYSSTELSAFAEACRKIGYTDSATFEALLHQLAPAAASIPADELPSLLWAASVLAAEAAPRPQQQAGPGAASAGTSPAIDAPSSSGSGGSSGVSSGRSVDVPQNDGVVGSISSSKLVGRPLVLEFVLGASQVLAGDLDELGCEELPIVAAALVGLEYRDPFLLTVLAESVLQRRAELSTEELLALVGSFAAMGPWFFDSQLLNGLTAELLARARAGGAVGRRDLQAVSAEFAAINHRSPALQDYLGESGA